MQTFRVHGYAAVSLLVLTPAAGAFSPLGAQDRWTVPSARVGTSPQGPPPHAAWLPVTRLDDRRQETSLDAARPVSLSLSEPLPVRDVLLLLFKGTPFSIVFEPSVSGTFQGELSDLTAREALEAVLLPAGLDYSADGGVIRVFARRPETRIFDVNHPNVSRTWERRLLSRGSASGVTSLTSTGAADFLEQVDRAIRALLSGSGSAYLDRGTGLIHVTDFPDRLERIGIFLEALSARAARQVRLQARVLEVALEGTSAVDWDAVARRAGPAVRAGSGGGIIVQDFDGLVRAIAPAGRVRVVAAPQVLATNNQPAVMRVGSGSAAAPFSIAPQGGSGGAEAAPAGEGLTLTLVPQVAADGSIHMSVSPALAQHVEGPGGERTLSVVEADTTLRVSQGETVMISGLVRETRESAPAGGIAGLFGRTTPHSVRTEIVILLTPTIVSAGTAPMEKR